MAYAPPLGHKVTTRDYNWGDIVRRAWGSEFFAPDHNIYDFPGNPKDSTDKGLTGIYGVYVSTSLQPDPADNYPDMEDCLQTSDKGQDIMTENAP